MAALSHKAGESETDMVSWNAGTICMCCKDFVRAIRKCTRALLTGLATPLTPACVVVFRALSYSISSIPRPWSVPRRVAPRSLRNWLLRFTT